MVSTEFTAREVEILRELVSGASNAEIAEKLSIEPSTVKMHISNMNLPYGEISLLFEGKVLLEKRPWLR